MLQLPKLFVNIKEFVSQEGLIWVDLTLHKAMLFFFAVSWSSWDEFTDCKRKYNIGVFVWCLEISFLNILFLPFFSSINIIYLSFCYRVLDAEQKSGSNIL